MQLTFPHHLPLTWFSKVLRNPWRFLEGARYALDSVDPRRLLEILGGARTHSRIVRDSQSKKKKFEAHLAAHLPKDA